MLRVIGNKESIASHVKITRMNINSITVLTYLDKFQLYRKHSDKKMKFSNFADCNYVETSVLSFFLFHPLNLSVGQPVRPKGNVVFTAGLRAI